MFLSLLAAFVIAICGFVAVGYWNAVADPVVRRLTLVAPEFPASAGPVRIVLLSDLHVHGPDMPPARVARIVAQVNQLHPDIAIAAGDFLGDNWVR